MVSRDDTVFTVVADADISIDKPYVYYTTDDLERWIPYDSTGLPQRALNGYQSPLFVTSHSLLLGASTPETGVYRYDFVTVPDIPGDVDRMDYPPLGTVRISRRRGEVLPHLTTASGRITIRSNQALQRVRLLDMQGRELREVSPYQARTDMDASSLRSGVYVLQILQKNGRTAAYTLVKR